MNQSSANKPEKQQAAIILHSDSYDRVTNALSLASICLAMEMEVVILLTYGGLKRFVTGHFEDSDDTDTELFEKIQRGITSGGNRSIENKLADARKIGLKVFACTNAMATMGISQEDLADEVDDVMGLATFVKFARNAAINWYI